MDKRIHPLTTIGVFLLSVLGMAMFAMDGVAWAVSDLPMPRELRIGFQTIPNTEAVVKALGWWDRLGVPVKWYQFDAGRDVNTALAAGSIDIGLVGTSPVAAGISQGIPYEVIWIYNGIGDNEALVVRKDSGIASAFDLIGRTIAVTFGSTTHYHLLKYLEAEGVSAADLRIVDMQPPEMLAAWLRGNIDGGWSWHPNLQHMIASGGEVLYTSRQMAEQHGILTGDTAVVRVDFANRYPHLVAHYLALQHEAVMLYREQPEVAVNAVSQDFGLDQHTVEQMMAELIWLDGFEQMTDRFLASPLEAGRLAVDLKETADFLQQQGVVLGAPALEHFEERVNSEYLALGMELYLNDE